MDNFSLENSAPKTNATMSNDHEQHFLEFYSNLNIDEKKIYWLRYFYQQSKWDGQFSNEEFSFVNPSNYIKWKELDPNIDGILTYVIKEIDQTYFADGEISKFLIKKLYG